MSLFLKAYKVQLYPNQEQELLLKKQIGCCRFIYNQLLAQCKLRREKILKVLVQIIDGVLEVFGLIRKIVQSVLDTGRLG